MNLSILNCDGHSIRVTLDENKQPLFCLSDVCGKLDIKNPNPKRFHLNVEGVHKMSSPTNSGIQVLTFISEDNLYRIIFRSTKPEALNFQNWVFAEVLPMIRKTGNYLARQTAYEELNRLCMQEKISKDKATFYSSSMHRRKYEKHLNAIRIKTCEANLQLAFEEEQHV